MWQRQKHTWQDNSQKGFGNFAPYQIAVIDDNVMSLNLFIARPKIRNTPPQHNLKDNLKPFTKFLPPYVKIIFYIYVNPVRIDFADVVIILKIDEQRRQKQLEQRERCRANKIPNERKNKYRYTFYTRTLFGGVALNSMI